MSRPYSCIIKSDLTLIEGQTVATHSHTGVMRQHGLLRELSIDQYACVELYPGSRKGYGSDPMVWKLILDEKREPLWWKDHLPEIEDRVRQAAIRWRARLLNIKSYNVADNETLIIIGDTKPIITQSGGEVLTYDSSTPQIVQSGGIVMTHDSSRPYIINSGGRVWKADNSNPVIVRV